MQQTRIAALLMALPALGALSAMADVTLYGTVDETFESVSARGASSANLNVPATTRINSNSSLIGFKGNEDLGNGVKTIWQVESGVSVDTGGGTFATRDSFVGLSSPAGTVQLGLLSGPARALAGAFDLNQGNTGIGMSGALLGKLGNLALTDAAVKTQATNAGPNGSGNTQAQTGPFDTRTRNAVLYTSPQLGQFNLSAFYGSGEKAGGPSAYTAELGARYDDGALFAGLSYGRLQTGADQGALLAQSAFRRVDDLRAALVYRFSRNTRVGLLYDRTGADATDAGAVALGGSSLRQTVWYLNGSLGITETGRLFAQYGQASRLSGASDAVAAEGKARHYEVGYEHDLSKRTLVKLIYSTIRNDAQAKYDFGIGSVGNVAAGADPRGIAVGLRHSF